MTIFLKHFNACQTNQIGNPMREKKNPSHEIYINIREHPNYFSCFLSLYSSPSNKDQGQYSFVPRIYERFHNQKQQLNQLR